ncbi:MAG: hypothetical protein HYR55_19735 [Acidobacteria bacterium]|nr:hypothetical protein [Acidobacteriota bacterium]MBI3656091.1 hypothetical protein [Acidobacteriota bacterium]
MVTVRRIDRSAFFYSPVATRAAAQPVAQAILDKNLDLPKGVCLFLTDGPLPAKVGNLSADKLADLIPLEKINLAQDIVNAIHYLGAEVGEGDYYLLTIMEEISHLPPLTRFSRLHFEALDGLRKKGVRFSDLPATLDEARDGLIEWSQQRVRVAIEYLLGNLEKTIKLLRLLGVRKKTINVSSLFHNFLSGFFEVDLSTAEPMDTLQILARAAALREQGVIYEIYRRSEFNCALADLSPGELESALLETSDSYGISEEIFRKFMAMNFSTEARRLAATPEISIEKLMTFFRFSERDAQIVAVPTAPDLEDPRRWKETELGKACRALSRGIDWSEFSAGIRAAGDIEAHRRNRGLRAQVGQVKQLAEGFLVTLPALNGEKPGAEGIHELSEDDLLVRLYGVAVLEKRNLEEVLGTAISSLNLIRQLENREASVALYELLSARLKGESLVAVLGAQGIVLRNSPIAMAMEKLKELSYKVSFTLAVDGGRQLPLTSAGIDDFRRGVLLMSRKSSARHSPEQVLTSIMDRIVPEIAFLPALVIDQTQSHDLGRIVELALAGIPPRYPLRRPWERIDSDRLALLGSGLEPGIRNCLGCPVNVLYGHVVKTALAMGFLDIITYEATGCFEVYSGIYPYTGKKIPTLHGVFGAAPSEMLGGLAARRARLRYALKSAQKNGQPDHVLHLGWGGDGGTFDIGFGNLSGLFSRLQRIMGDELDQHLTQRALYVCYDNEGYQNTGNQYSAATSPGGNTTTYPQGAARPAGSDLRKKPIVEIIADHGVSLSARLGIHRPEHISRVVSRALADGDRGAFIHFLQPCTTGWKFTADNIAYDLAWLAEAGGLFTPVTIEHGVAYMEVYPTGRNPERAFMEMQARFKHLLSSGPVAKNYLDRVMGYYRTEWERVLRLTGFAGEIRGAHRLAYLEPEHRRPKINV